MNRGRHKKSKEKGFNTQTEILDTIQKELRVLLSIYNDRSSHSKTDYYAKAWISSNNGRDYYRIVTWYIKNSIYTIKFEFGHNTKIFKYKHA